MKSRSQNEQWHMAAFVPDHSGGSVPDFHRFPYYALLGHHQVSDHPETAFLASDHRSRSFAILDVSLRLRLQKRCGLGLNQKLPFLDGHKLRSMQIR